MRYERPMIVRRERLDGFLTAVSVPSDRDLKEHVLVEPRFGAQVEREGEEDEPEREPEDEVREIEHPEVRVGFPPL